MAGNLRFDELRLFQAAFEVRFDEALLLWDRAGLLWEQIVKAAPELKRQHAEPNRVVFASSSKPEMEITIELGRLGFVQYHPDKRLETFSDTVSKITNIASAIVEITQYSRIGLRLMFEKEFLTPEAAAEAVLSTGLIRPAERTQFGISAAVSQPDVGFRREDGKNGFYFHLKSETATFDFKPTIGWSEFTEPITKKKHRVNFDIDAYLQAPVSAEMMRFPDWISQTFHIIKRDSVGLIEG